MKSFITQLILLPLSFLAHISCVVGFLSPLQYAKPALIHPLSPSSSTSSSSPPPSRHFMSTWSDARAVMDYQEFLSSGKQIIELATDIPSVIVTTDGPTAQLAMWLKENGLTEDIILTPDQDLPETVAGNSEYPVYIAIPPYYLNYFLVNLNDSYKKHMDNFCFFSGGLSFGNIEDVLKERGYCRDAMTQILISGLHIAPNGRGEDISVNLGLDGYGESKIAGDCTACGKWAGAIGERLERSNVRCSTDFYREWRRKMWERNVLDACFHLLGCVRDQPTTVADVAKYYGEEVSDMVWDMSQLLKGWRALTLLFGFEERIFGVAEMRGDETPCYLIEEMYPFIWGNQVFLQSKMFVEYLTYAKMEKGFLPNTPLPQRAVADFQSKMRPGNLRADGVV
ncbi:hypothetical protein ACA910_020435 [Epithemia clementina (nom. ined.)]